MRGELRVPEIRSGEDPVREAQQSGPESEAHLIGDRLIEVRFCACLRSPKVEGQLVEYNHERITYFAHRGLGLRVRTAIVGIIFIRRWWSAAEIARGDVPTMTPESVPATHRFLRMEI